MIELLDAFKTIKLGDGRLQLVHCWCYDAGLTRFRKSTTALAQWLGTAGGGVAAVYLLPTTRDAEVANAHLEADSTLAPLAPLSSSPEPGRVLVRSCQQWLGEGLVGKTLALRDLVIVVDLGAGVTSSFVSAMAAALFTELPPRDRSPSRTFSVVVLQEMTIRETIGNYILHHDMVGRAVQGKGWQVVTRNTRVGPHLVVNPKHMPPGCPLTDAGFDEAQRESAMAALQGGYEQAVAAGRDGEAYKAVVLMSRPRFRRLMDTITFAKARSFFIHDGTPAKLVQAICEDEEPGLTVVGIATEVCILPQVRGMQLLIADCTTSEPAFDPEIGQPVAREADAVFMRMTQLLDVGHGDAGLEACILWEGDLWEGSGDGLKLPVLFPFYHTDEMFHLIIKLADICPGQSLHDVPCLPLQEEVLVLYERVRRLGLWGVIEHTGNHATLAVSLTDRKGRLVSGLAQHESNIHSLLLLAGAADPDPALSARGRHLLVWLAAVVAHDPQHILAHPGELAHGSPAGGPASGTARSGNIWSALLGVRDFSRRNDQGNEAQRPSGQAVEAAEAQQVLDRVAFWVGELQLPAETAPFEEVAGREKAVVERQLVHAYIYNLAIFDMSTAKLGDLLSGTELGISDDARALLVAFGQRFRARVAFAIYTGLHVSARGISPTNLTIVSEEAVYFELLRIAPRPQALPGTSPIDLSILKTRTAPPVALQ